MNARQSQQRAAARSTCNVEQRLGVLSASHCGPVELRLPNHTRRYRRQARQPLLVFAREWPRSSRGIRPGTALVAGFDHGDGFACRK